MNLLGDFWMTNTWQVERVSFSAPGSGYALCRCEEEGHDERQSVVQRGAERVRLGHDEALQERHPVEDLSEGHLLLVHRRAHLLKDVPHACKPHKTAITREAGLRAEAEAGLQTTLARVGTKPNILQPSEKAIPIQYIQ